MRYIITPSQIHFFRTHGYIAFQGIVPVQNLVEEYKTCQDFSSCHNLPSSAVSKYATNRKNAKIAKELLGQEIKTKEHLRLLFHQSFLAKIALPTILQQPVRFCEFSSFQGLCLLLVVQLSDTMASTQAISNNSSTTQEEIPTTIALPLQKNDCLFFRPDCLVDFSNSEKALGNFLLIGYGHMHTIYNRKEKDPFNNFVQFAQGDIVSNAQCPLLL